MFEDSACGDILRDVRRNGMAKFERAIVAPRDATIGKTARGDDVNVIARASDTNGMIGIWESVIEPGTGPDWHSHSRELEVFRIISGSFRFWCGTEVFDGGPGTTVVLPPNIPHQWKNIGTEPGLLFTVVTPGGFEQNFVDIASLSEVTDASLAEIDRRLGVTEGAPV
jgi:mannose-6-phosphate isomerase-like protein (cupin superfamily)